MAFRQCANCVSCGKRNFVEDLHREKTLPGMCASCRIDRARAQREYDQTMREQKSNNYKMEQAYADEIKNRDSENNTAGNVQYAQPSNPAAQGAAAVLVVAVITSTFMLIKRVAPPAIAGLVRFDRWVSDGVTTQVRGHNPIFMAFFGLWPGLGQAIMGQKKKGLVLFIGYLAISLVTFFLGAIVIIPLSVVDAFKIAKKIRSGEDVGEWDAYLFNKEIDLTEYLPSSVTGVSKD